MIDFGTYEEIRADVQDWLDSGSLVPHLVQVDKDGSRLLVRVPADNRADLIYASDSSIGRTTLSSGACFREKFEFACYYDRATREAFGCRYTLRTPVETDGRLEWCYIVGTGDVPPRDVAQKTAEESVRKLFREEVEFRAQTPADEEDARTPADVQKAYIQHAGDYDAWLNDFFEQESLGREKCERNSADVVAMLPDPEEYGRRAAEELLLAALSDDRSTDMGDKPRYVLQNAARYLRGFARIRREGEDALAERIRMYSALKSFEGKTICVDLRSGSDVLSTKIETQVLRRALCDASADFWPDNVLPRDRKQASEMFGRHIPVSAVREVRYGRRTLYAA